MEKIEDIQLFRKDWHIFGTLKIQKMCQSFRKKSYHQKWPKFNQKWSKMATYLRDGSHYKTKKYVYEISIIKHIFAQIVFRSIMNFRKVKECFIGDHFCNFCEIGAISWADICSFWTPLSISKNVWHPDSRFQFNGNIASYR